MNLTAKYLMAVAQVMEEENICSVPKLMDGGYENDISKMMVKLGVEKPIADVTANSLGRKHLRACMLNL